MSLRLNPPGEYPGGSVRGAAGGRLYVLLIVICRKQRVNPPKVHRPSTKVTSVCYRAAVKATCSKGINAVFRQVTIVGPVHRFLLRHRYPTGTSPDTVVGMDPTPSEPAVEPVRSASWFSSPRARVASRHLMNAAILLALPTLLAATLNRAKTLLVDPDIWWHLANARIFVTTHHAIWHDPYSFTVAGHAWIDWEWLSELPFLFSYQTFGLQGIYLVTWLLLGANVLFVYYRGVRLGGSADAALWTSAIALVLMTVNSGPRTIEFAYLAMSSELLILEEFDRGNKRLIWLLPPLFALWINLHGFWFAGIVLLAMYIGFGLFHVELGAFEQQALSRPDRNRLLMVLGASVAALVLNPYGWHLMLSPLDMMLHQKTSVATIAEWQPLELSSFEGRGAVLAIVLMVLINCIRGRKWKIYEMAFVFLAWYAAISHHRFTYFAAVLTTPMLARDRPAPSSPIQTPTRFLQ